MTRYFFHIKDGAELIQDPEGSELATLADARSQALKSARELWADAIKSGRLAYKAGRIQRKLYATASSPLEGKI